MIYPWFEFSDVLCALVPDVYDVELSVTGDDLFVFDGIERGGASGKTCWYVPLSRREANRFGLSNADVGLKVIKYSVYADAKDEYDRLLQEFTIQKILFANGLAPDIFKIVVIRNAKPNSIPWLGGKIDYPENSVLFALLVENIGEKEGMSDVKVGVNGNLYGAPIEAFRNRCRQLRIEPYDLTAENICQVHGRLCVLDVHKWRRTYVICPNKAPKYLQIELNNTCNAKCCMCAIPHMTRPRGNMSDALFEKILKEADALGVEYITPFLHGEPFMRKDFIEKLHRINECAPRAKITIFTNASYLNEKNAIALGEVKNIEQVVFSFPGGNKEIYEAVTGLGFEKAVHNIRRAFQVLKGFNLRISMPLCELNKCSEEDFERLWEGFPHSSYKTYNYLGDSCGSLASNSYEQCDRAFRTMTVMFDGRVCLCCMDADGRYVMGDLSEQSLEAVWNGPEFTRLRADHGRCRLAYKPCDRCTQDLKTEEYNNAYNPCLV